MVATAIAAGAALDMRSVFYLIRLSPRYPTVEVRVEDLLLTADEAAAYAALVRALVVQALDDAAAGRPIHDIDQDRLISACAAAAHGGLTHAAAVGTSGQVRRGWELVDALVSYLLPSLARDPDATRVLSTLELVRFRGGGTDRQRQLWRRGDDPAGFTRSLARWTTAPGPQWGTAGQTSAEAVVHLTAASTS
jgi:carboxylate-amine ligase